MWQIILTKFQFCDVNHSLYLFLLLSLFNISEGMGNERNIFLTGKPGIGKTTIIKKVITGLNLKIGGFYTEEIREKGKRVGFKVRSSTGEETLLAHVDFKSPYNVGKYGVDINSFEIVGVRALENALSEAELIIIDELGRMELFSKKFQAAVLKVLDSDKRILGVIQQKKNPFLDSIRARKDVQVLIVNEINRDELPSKLKTMITHLVY